MSESGRILLWFGFGFLAGAASVALTTWRTVIRLHRELRTARRVF